MASSTWLLFNELSSRFYSGVRLRYLLWESPLEHYLDGGMITKSITHTWLVMFLSCLVPLCLWIYFVLFCTQGFAYPMSYIFVLRDTDQTMPLHESFQQCIAVNQGYVLLGTSLSRSTVSLLLSFTLKQASATTSHSIMPSRGNCKFTCLGFVRGCLWAWLYWSGSWIYDSWNGLSSSHIQKWSSHYHLFLGNCQVWFLPIILIYETYYLLLSSTSLWVFSILRSSEYHAQYTPYKHKAFHDWLSLWQRSQAYCWNTTLFLLFWKR